MFMLHVGDLILKSVDNRLLFSNQTGISKLKVLIVFLGQFKLTLELNDVIFEVSNLFIIAKLKI